MQITPQQVEQYHSEGYFIFENAMTAAQLDSLRAECDRYVREFDADMEARGVTSKGISHYKKRYFISNRGHESPAITQFLFSPLMADIARATLGNNAYLFNEQYVVKAAEVGTKFGWHQDSGYVGHYHKPYLSCWCALDDMTEANGTVYILPYSRAGLDPDEIVEHVVEAGTNDKVGYHGDDPGIPAIVPAGSIVVFSSRTFHRSGTNTTDRMRRSYLAQYSAEPIMNRDGDAYWNKAVPLLVNGERVAPRFA
jgi:ectoine hydroxylase-related dioxygenase (phytanoyl-CoA dioxygenase family)